MADAPEIRKGAASVAGTQLQQGEATSLNKAVAQTKPKGSPGRPNQPPAAQQGNSRMPAEGSQSLGEPASPEAQGGGTPTNANKDTGGFAEPFDMTDGPTDETANYTPTGDVEQWLFQQPPGSEGMPTPTGAFNHPDPPPADIHEWLPLLGLAASDPEAPPRTKMMYDMVRYHLAQHADQS